MTQDDFSRLLREKLAGIDLRDAGLVQEASRSGDPVFTLDGVLLESRYDPLKSARARLAQLDPAGKRAAVLFGDGGYYLAGLLAEQGLQVVVVEPLPSLAAAVFKARPALPWGKIIPVFPAELSEPGDWERVLPSGITPAELLTVEHPVLSRRFSGQFQQPRSLLIELFRRRVADLETTAWFGRRWLHNILDNLSVLQQRGASRIAHRAAPAVIAVPGPGLSACIPALKRLRAECRLIALAPALPLLLEHRLVPDLVCSMDGGFANLLHFSGRLPAVPLVFPLYLYGRIVRHWPGVLVPVSFGLPAERLLAGEGVFPRFDETATVALFAVQAAFRFGATEAVLAGQDFAAAGCRHHAPGYKFDEDRILFRAVRQAPAEKLLDIHWREDWDREDGFYMGSKLKLYRDDMVRILRNKPVSVMEPSPFISQLPRFGGGFRGGIPPEPELIHSPVAPSPEATRLAERLTGLLDTWDEAIRCPEQFLAVLAADPLLRPVLELLRGVDLFSLDRGDRTRALDHFFAGGLELELQSICKKLHCLLKVNS